MDDLITKLRRGVVYGDPRNIGASGEFDEAETDGLMNIAAAALEDAYAKISDQRAELDLLRPGFFGDASNDRRGDGLEIDLNKPLADRWREWCLAVALADSANKPPSQRSQDELDRVLLKAAEIIQTGAGK